MAKPQQQQPRDSNVTPLRAMKCSPHELRELRAALNGSSRAQIAARSAQVEADRAQVQLAETIRGILEAHNAPPSWGIDDETGTILKESKQQPRT